MPAPAAVPIAIGAAIFLDWLNQRGSTNKAADRQLAALDKAQGSIQGAADKAMSYQEPYLKNAGQDYNQLRGLVQSGFFQQPGSQSFSPVSQPAPNFAFNPSQGAANFQPRGAGQGLVGFTPQAMPQMPQFAPPGPPQQAPGGPTQMMRAPGPTPVQGLLEQSQQSVMAPHLGPMAPPMPNKNQTPHPIVSQMTPPSARSPGQPMTLQEMDAILRAMRGSGPFMPKTRLLGGRR